jgi:hypothetical protein
MKRLLALIAGIAALLALSVTAPANAQESKIPCDKAKMCKTMGPLVATVAKVPASADTQDWGFQAPQVTPDTTDTAGNGFAMGVSPNWWTLCVANGYGPTVGRAVLGWNWPPRQPTISLQNRCDGYSITNRMTIDNINNSGACIQYTNLGHSASPLGHLHSAFYIWNQNPVIWVNTRSGCADAGEIEHDAAKGVGYILGLAYSTCSDCVMGNSNAITQALSQDSLDVNVIYEKP